MEIPAHGATVFHSAAMAAFPPGFKAVEWLNLADNALIIFQNAPVRATLPGTTVQPTVLHPDPPFAFGCFRQWQGRV
jgi:hypothetical protein